MSSRPPSTRRDIPVRQRSLREHNLALVLRHIAGGVRPVSRAATATASGLTRATISTIVDELIAGGLVVEVEPGTPAGAGRPATGLVLSPTGPAGLGLEINVDYQAACVVDLSGTVRHRGIIHADQRDIAPEAAWTQLAELAAAARLAATEQGLTVAGAVIAVPGLLRQQTILVAPNLGWQLQPVPDAGPLHATLESIPIRVENEAKLAALGELHATDLRSFIYVSGEIGIGAGIVLDGELLRGNHGWAGELGHLTIDAEGLPCRCGARGCLEQYAGQDAIRVAAGLPAAPAGRDALAVLLNSAGSGHPASVAAIERAGAALGQALSGAINLLDIPAVVLGGHFAPLAPWLTGPIEEQLSRRVVTARWAPPQVRPSALGGDATVIGAARAVVQSILDNPAGYLAAG